MNDEHAVGSALLTRLDGEYPQVIWEALREIGVDPDSPDTEIQQRFCTEYCPAGIPIEFTARLPEQQIRVAMKPTNQLVKAYRAATTFDVEIRPEQATAIDTATELMRELIVNFELKRRDLCLAAGAFLGLERYAWHDLTIGTMNIPAFHEIRGQVFADWQLLSEGDPRQGQLTVQRMKDLNGEEVSVTTNARFYYRQDGRRLVVDLHATGQIHIAGSGVDKNEIDNLIRAIDKQLSNVFGSISRAVTAKGESVILDETVSWEDLYLDAETSKLLRSEVKNFFDNRELFQQMKIPHRRGLLLHGVPGTGKTMFGKVLVSTIEDCLFLWITASDVESSESIASIFSIARASDRAILFFEDLDMYASRRGRYGNDTATLGELMVQMDGMHSNEGIMVIATTNDLEAIEPALKDRPSRFDRVIEFLPPPQDVRKEFLLSLLGEFGVSDRQAEAVAAETGGFTGAQTKELAIVAKSTAAQRGSDVIEPKDLEEAVHQARRFKAVPTGFGGVPIPNSDDDYE